MLHRMEEDYEGAQRLLSLLAVSEHGLSEEEIITITGLRQIDFYLFYCAISEHIVTRNGLLTFGHQYITVAVWSRYQLDDMDSTKPYRESIINYFNSNEISDHQRQISELAFQYYVLEDCYNLYKTILDFDVFKLFNSTTEGKKQLALYWRKLIKSNQEKFQLRDYLDLSYDETAFKYLQYLNIGNFILDYLADYKTAILYFDKVTHYEEGESLNTASAYNNIGEAYRFLGDYTMALKNYFEALNIWKVEVGEDNIDTAQTYNNIGMAYYYQKCFSQALDYFIKSLTIKKKMFVPDCKSIARTKNNIGAVLLELKEYSKALEFFSETLSFCEDKLGINDPFTADSYNNIGSVYMNKGDNSMALQFLIKALNIREKVFGLEHPKTGATYNNIGKVYHYQGDYCKALEYYSKALKIFETALGVGHPNTLKVKQNIEDSLTKMKE
jgi:preprotein translocase subunit SecA/nephrocystin-3